MLNVSVAGQDISGVVLELQKGVTITGQVTAQAATPPADYSRTMINLFPAAPDSNMMRSVPPARRPPSKRAGGSRSATSSRARYRVNAGVPGGTPAAPSLIVQSVTVDGEDALDMPLAVKGRGINGMAVAMTDRITELSGTIVDEKGKPAIEHTLVLYPVDEKYWFFQSRRIRTTRAGEDGHYTFRVVPPGDYRLATVLDPDPGALFERRC